ncbi:hypothetical protein FACS1894181_05480 [Bacteroidia bacterium]|nr:hypothetical protein FACS1894181_05480 [Bacteroidia bacterium]
MKKSIYYASLILLAFISLPGCNTGQKHPWIGKAFETISKEEGYHIRGGDPHTEGLDYIVFILKQDAEQMPSKAVFLTKEHVILGVTDVGFTSDIFYMVENVTHKKDNRTVQYLVKKHYFPETDTAEPLELWGYNKKSKTVERIAVTGDLEFGH